MRRRSVHLRRDGVATCAASALARHTMSAGSAERSRPTCPWFDSRGVGAERERQLDPGRGAGRGQRRVVATDPTLDQVEEATLVAIRGREVEGEARHRIVEAAVHVAVRDRCVAPLVDVDEMRLPPVVPHPVRERTARLSPKQATASFPAVLDVVLRGGDVVDGTGAPRRRPTSGSATGASSRSAPSTSRRRARIDVRRARGRARLRRHPHALRRAAAVGPDVHAVAAARRHHRDRRQLRVHDRAARRRATSTTSCG